MTLHENKIKEQQDAITNIKGKLQTANHHGMSQVSENTQQIPAAVGQGSWGTKIGITGAANAARDIAQKARTSGNVAAEQVYDTTATILNKVKQNGDFSSKSIGDALKKATEASAYNNGQAQFTPKQKHVGMYQEDIDGGAYGSGKSATQGYSAPIISTKKDPSADVNKGILDCITRSRDANIDDASPKHPQNPSLQTSEKIGDEWKVTYNAFDAVKPNDRQLEFDKPDGTKGKYTWPEGFDPQKYKSQLGRESDTYSGDVSIHKLEPGTVLVRVFGQGQSVKASCWCRLNDDTSSFTCARDLYEKLAVKPEWNGDGNMGIFVVPNDAEVWVAEGTIASQKGTYTATELTPTGRERDITESFTYQGGGIQLNILTPDKGSFAGVDQEVFNQCIFCFRNDGIMNSNANV